MKKLIIVVVFIMSAGIASCGSSITPDPILNGTVVNPGGSPIAGAIVDLGTDIISTPDNGSFTKTWPASAIEFTIVIRARGYNTYMEKLHIEGGQPMTKQFMLTAWTPDGGLTGTLRGRVQCGEGGGGIAGATVSIEGTTLSTTTDENGNYELNDVPSGEQQINVDKDGYIPYGETQWIYDNFDNVHNPVLAPDE